MIGDLEALFDGVDGIKEDLTEFGIAGVSALAANAAYSKLYEMVADKLPAGTPSWAQDAGRVALGLYAGRMLGKMNFPYARQVATGAAVGLVGVGLGGLIKGLTGFKLPGVAGLSSLRNVDYVSGYLNGATVSVEEQGVSGFAGVGNAPTTYEQVNGVDDFVSALN